MGSLTVRTLGHFRSQVARPIPGKEIRDLRVLTVAQIRVILRS